MLLVAIPKSASTALMETVARAHGLRCQMRHRWPGPKAAEFPKFGLQHKWDMELDAETARYFVEDSTTLFKVHVLPTTNNLTLLRGQKKAVLLRSPEGIVGAYKRGHETGVYPQRTESFDGCRTEEDWLARARVIGIYDDLARFREKWLTVDDDKLVIEYEGLISDPKREIARLESYFGLPASGTDELLRRKYTRLGDESLAYHRATKKLWKTLAE